MAEFRAAWWWIDRWRKSTAYTDLTLAEQGAYRNLLDELWLRDGLLPLSERSLANICGDATLWPEVRGNVLRRFQKTPEGYRNSTHDQIAGESRRRAEKQRRYRERNGNSGGNGDGNASGNARGSPDQSPSPDQEQSPKHPPKPPRRGGRAARRKVDVTEGWLNDE